MIRFLLTLVSLLSVLGSASASAALPAAQTTPIPRDRRPDFRPFRFMVGRWNCSVESSRRPRPFPATSTTEVTPDGYWLVTTMSTPPVPWNNIRITAKDYITYDPTRSLWVDLTMDDYGLYGVSTSKGWADGAIVWDDVMFPKSHATSMHLPRIERKNGDRSITSIQRFKEPSGAQFSVTTSCTKA